MRSNFPSDVLEECADRPRAAAGLEQLRASSAGPALRKLSAEPARVLAALLSGSQTALETLLAHPEWLAPLLAPGYLAHPRRQERLRLEVERDLRHQDHEAALSLLRRFKQQEMLRIAARDLARLDHVVEITREISDVADVCLQAVHRLCQQRLRERFGQPWHLDAGNQWRETEFCLIGLGKLGGQELNYSSDVDLIFVYSEEGNVFKTPPRQNEPSGRGMANHQFFARLAEAIIAEIGKLTPDGSLFRVDMRLRPEGKAGPLARSAASYENYYAQWGQTWERMMLIKARPVAGDAALGAEFLEMTQSFRYPRSLNPRTLREVAAVKKRIETEVVKAGRTGAQRQTGPRRHPRDRVCGADHAASPRRPASLSARRRDDVHPAKAGPLFAALCRRRRGVGGGLRFPAPRRAPPANGGRPPNPHHPHRAARPAASGAADGIRERWRNLRRRGGGTPPMSAAFTKSCCRATSRPAPHSPRRTWRRELKNGNNC